MKQQGLEVEAKPLSLTGQEKTQGLVGEVKQQGLVGEVKRLGLAMLQQWDLEKLIGRVLGLVKERMQGKPVTKVEVKKGKMMGRMMVLLGMAIWQLPPGCWQQ